MSHEKQLTVVEQREISFYDDQVIAVKVEDGAVYVPIRPICDLIGVDRRGQQQRIERDLALSSVARNITIMVSGGVTPPQGRAMLCIPLDFLNGWLFGINASRVKEEIKAKLIQYQIECYRVLYEAFGRNEVTAAPDPLIDELMKGDSPEAQAYQMAMAVANMARQQLAIKARVETNSTQLSDHENRLQVIEADYGNDARYITNAQAVQLAQAIKQIALELGKRSKRNEFGGVYGELHRQFSIPGYKQLPSAKFNEAMNFLRQWWETLTDSSTIPF